MSEYGPGMASVNRVWADEGIVQGSPKVLCEGGEDVCAIVSASGAHQLVESRLSRFYLEEDRRVWQQAWQESWR
jgi:hypothetical protein